MRFADIEAQETAARTLRSSIKKSSVAHAYLFSGPRSSGKTTTALAFASALNCADLSPDGDACGKCLSCLRIEAGTDADVRVISPDGNQTKMDQMQEMIRSLNYSPISGRYKVFIVEQADTLNSSSENCILKILEEPPSFAVLILLSRNPNSLLATIRSRCRTVRFRRAGSEEIEQALRKHFSLSDEDIRVVSACSQGTVGAAWRMASDTSILEDRRAVLHELKNWAEGSSVLSLQTAEIFRDMAKPPKNNPEGRTLVKNLNDMMEHILSWYSDLLVLKVRGEDSPVTNADFLDDLIAQSHRYTTARVRTGIRSIMTTRRYLEGNITPQLVLENLFFDLHPEA